MAEKKPKDKDIVDEKLEEAASEEPETEDEEESVEAVKDKAAESWNRAEEAPAAAGEWFVDFDVWQATLEANFGPDFEAVLSNVLGPEWITQLNSRLQAEKEFYKVIEQIKAEIMGPPPEEEEELGEPGSMSFESLGSGEVIFDSSTAEFGIAGGRGGGGRGGGGSGGGGGRSLPNLKDLRRKEFEGEEVPEEAKKNAPVDQNIINDEEALPDSELVLMDANEFTRMSYYAHKEMERHKDELKIKEVLERESKEKQAGKTSLQFRLLFWLSVSIALYAVLCIASYPVSSYYAKGLLERIPPDFYFQPSNALHKQGELTRVRTQPADGQPEIDVIYFYRPAVKRLDIQNLLNGIQYRYSLKVAQRNLIEPMPGSDSTSVTMRRYYPQYLPTNFSVLARVPFLTVSEKGQELLTAYEWRLSGLLPGLVVTDIVDSAGKAIGTAYVADGRLNIAIPALDTLAPSEKAELAYRLVLLFALLEL